MPNPFDQFDAPARANPFDQFDGGTATAVAEAPDPRRAAKGRALRGELMAERRSGYGADALMAGAGGAEFVVDAASKMITSFPRAAYAVSEMITPTGQPFVDRPTIEKWTPEMAATVRRAIGGPGSTDISGDETAAGVANAVSDFGEFFTTPEGVATLGAGAAPALARAALGAGFAGQMSSHVPEAFAQAGELSAGDDRAAAVRAGLGALGTAVFAGAIPYGAIKHQSTPRVLPPAERAGKMLEAAVNDPALLDRFEQVANELALERSAPESAQRGVVSGQRPAPAGLFTAEDFNPFDRFDKPPSPSETVPPEAAPASQPSTPPLSTSPALRGEAAMETRPTAKMGLDRTQPSTLNPELSTDLAETIAALRAGYRPEVEKAAEAKPAKVRAAKPKEQPKPPDQAAPAMQEGMDNLRFTSDPVKTAKAGGADAKDAKTKLIAELEKAVEASPFEDEAQFKRFNDVLANPPETAFKASNDTNMGAGFQARYQQEYEAAQRLMGRPQARLPKVTIEIPGDGTFTLANTKANLREVLDSAKRLSTSRASAWGGPSGKVGLTAKERQQKIVADAEAVYGPRRAVAKLREQAANKDLELEAEFRGELERAADTIEANLPENVAREGLRVIDEQLATARGSLAEKEASVRSDLATAKQLRSGEVKPRRGRSAANEAMNSEINANQTKHGISQLQHRIKELETRRAKTQGELDAAQPPTPPARIEASPKAVVPGNVEDFGEKLGGARKDQSKSIARDLTDGDLASMSLSEIWPRSELEGIADKDKAAVAHAVRSIIPAKPRQAYKLAQWVERVKMVKELMRLSETMGHDELLAKMSEPSRRLEMFANKIRLLRVIDRDNWDRIGEIHNYPDAFEYSTDGKTRTPKPTAMAEVDGTRVRAANLTELADKVNERLGVAAPESRMEFEVRGRRDGKGGFSISKKGDPLYRKLKTFETSKEALDFARAEANRAELEQAWEGVKERDNVKETDVRREDNRPRVGADHRKGADATPQMFLDSFGFRGVEFGNWVSQGKNAKERQGMLNAAFDALHDLANVLGVPPQALSLRGKLGIGMGSRGHGWASAHYEPGNVVINLTKTRGAGSLAHEWFHALDHYFQKFRNETGLKEGGRHGDYITQAPETYYESTDGRGHRLTESRYKELLPRNKSLGSWKKVEGVRPAVAEAFAELVKALDASPMAKRAALVDKGKSGGYWSGVIERAARSFENYVISKMQEKGYHNDYLANVASIEEFARGKDHYPYLLAEEMKPVVEAFDRLFQTIETKKEVTPEGREIIGMGGAVPSEFAGNSGTPTGIKNATVDAERARRGLPPAMESARRDWGSVWDEAMARIDNDPAFQDRLIAELKAKPRALTDTEDALLLHRQIDLQNEYGRITRELAVAYEDSRAFPNRLADVEALKARTAEVSDQLLELYNVNKAAGTETGRGLAARKMMANEDYTLAAMEMEKRAALGGAPLTDAERSAMSKLHERIVELEAKAVAREEQVATERASRMTDEAIADMKRELASKPSYSPQLIKIAEEILGKLKVQANKSRDHFKGRVLSLSPEDIYHLGVIGAEKIARTGLDVTKFGLEMAAEFGDGITPYIKAVWDRANLHLDNEGAKYGDKSEPVKRLLRKRDAAGQREGVIEGLKKAQAEGLPVELLGDYVRKLALSFVRAGVAERNALVDAVYKVLTEDIGMELSRRETMDAISGYGRFKPLDADAAKAQLRDLKGQMQQVAKLEDITAKKPLQKTGVERRSQSDEERRLIQQVNEAKRRHGVVVTDPARQLKSALAARTTALKHRKADLEYQIATRERIVKTKTPTPFDAETKLLEVEVENLTRQLDELVPRPGITDGQRSAMAERSVEREIAVLEEQIKTGDVKARTARPIMSTAKLESLKARREALRAERQELRELDGEFQRQQAEKSLAQQKASLEAGIAAREKALAEGPKPPVGREVSRPADPALESLMQKRDALNRQLAEARKKPWEVKHAEQVARQLAAMEKSIAEREAKLAAGDLSTEARAKVARPLADPVLEQARQKLDDVNRRLAEARKPKGTPEERALKALHTRLTTSAAEYAARLARGDFAPRVRKPVPTDPTTLRLKAEAERAKVEWREGLERDRFRNLSPTKKAIEHAKEVLNLPRAVLSSWDVSAVLRQGGFITLNPRNYRRALAALVPMFRALANETRAHMVDQEIHARPNAPLYARAKLFLAPLDTSKLTAMEEVFMSRMSRAVPGVRASERAYITFLNKLRADSFDAMVDRMQAKGPPLNDVELQGVGNAINVSTGRGDMGSAAAAAETLATIFFSPRLVVSRFQLITGQPLRKAGSARVARAVAAEYAGFLGGLAVVFALANMAGAEVEPDTNSSDAGKLRFGNTRVDPLAGLAQATVLLSRLVTGETKSISGKVKPIVGDLPYGADTAPDVIFRFLRTKLSPVVGAAVDLRQGENVVGEKVTPTTTLQRIAVPLSFQEIYQVMLADGIPKGTALGILSLFGWGLQQHDDRKPKK